MLRSSEAILLDVRNEIPDLVNEERADPENACYTDDDKCQARFAEVEVVERRIDKGKDFEEGIVDAIRK